MPIIVCECRTGIAPATKAAIARDMTREIEGIIRSPLDLISIVFHDLPPENFYRRGDTSTDALIFCHIRDGRSDGAILSLAKAMSAVWHGHTGTPEADIEVAVATYPARWVVRGGDRLPEAPKV